MGFFENLGKTLSDAGQKTVAKTKELTEVARLNSQISSAEKKMLEAYAEIGKKFVAENRDTCGEEYKPLIAVAEDLDKQITSLKQQIQDVKGVQRCPSCGAEVARGVTFCSSCGAAMPLPEFSATTAAVAVTTEVPETPVAETVAEAPAETVAEAVTEMVTETVAEAPVVEAAVEEPATKVCPNCGEPQTDDSMFCANCGSKIEA